MCGIAGCLLAGGDNIDMFMTVTNMLIDIEHRGQDATGVAWWDDEGIVVVKAPLTAKKFVRTLAVPSSARVVIGHTRAWTQGNPAVNDNNHPLRSGSLVGTHNGVLYDDDDIFDKVGKQHRMAEVDSEAAFAALMYGQGVLGDTTGAILSSLDGWAALAWLDDRDPGALHLARCVTSPLWIGTTANGSVFYASTKDAVVRAAWSNGLDVTLCQPDEGTYLRIATDGVVTNETFVVEDGRSLFRSITVVGRSSRYDCTCATPPNGAGWFWWDHDADCDLHWSDDFYDHRVLWDDIYQEFTKPAEVAHLIPFHNLVEAFGPEQAEALCGKANERRLTA